MASILATLSLAGIIERSGRARCLRLAPRFLTHVERTARSLSAVGVRPEPAEVLRSALRTWDEYRQDTEQGARFLLQVIEDRDPTGLLRPVFPPLERFLAAA